ncbi:class C sortase [Acetatifactor muris]|uniref:Sortase family protein n=1 Tax=Acetatifactor muris TaxID=879566 RepID=A0A2K4ZAI7_9FIRM|nr:class C sortase [Acetatifactor muris]MCR2047582.1 class C sortase [Acetatifactor muris]SOY27478.1 Sortase family protein [Acetatifactor muris]
MKKHLSTIILTLILMAGLSLLLYPTVSDYWNSLHQSRAIANYEEAVAALDEETYEEYWNQAAVYNEKLWNRPNRYYLSEEEREGYEALLNISGNGIMGYIQIPSIDVSLPIYHGVDEAVLQVAAGHIESSSLPVGGESTHCVLSGHRGLPSARLFTDLDQLVEGDLFMLQVLNETLTYQVDQIRIVLPEEVEELDLSRGKDYCTLVTCTPYGINTHRLLVRGTRIDNLTEAAAIRVTPDARLLDPKLVAPAIAIPMLLVLLAWLLIKYRKK